MDESRVISTLESKNLTDVTRVGDTSRFMANFEVGGIVEEIEVNISTDEPAYNSLTGYKCRVLATDGALLIYGNPYGNIQYSISEVNWNDLAGKIELWRKQKKGK